MIVGAVTDVGLVRDNNQDSMFASLEKEFPLFIVADGMGGHNAGEIASNMAVNIIKEKFLLCKDNMNCEENIKDVFESAIVEANKEIYLKSLDILECNGMGTTVTLAYIYKSKAYIFHVGDSRAYYFRDNKLVQITEDHSLVNELVKNGSITPEEAINHPQKNMITRAVGTSYKIKMDSYIIDYTNNDILILCSDGLSNMIKEEDIINIFIKQDNIQNACEELVSLAKSNGGRDNITVISVKVENEEVRK